MAKTKDLMKKSPDLTDYECCTGTGPNYCVTRALHPSLPHLDSKHHLML